MPGSPEGPSTELPWLFLGRKIAPFLLAASLAAMSIAFVEFVSRNDYGRAFDDLSVAGLIVGSAAVCSTLALWWGWWARSHRAARIGLLLFVGVFATRAAFFFDQEGTAASSGAWLAVAWTVGGAGAYLLEVSANTNRGRV